MSLPRHKKGVIYNVNFPDLPADKIKGIRVGYQGKGRWIKEFTDWNPDIYSKFGLTPEIMGQSRIPKTEDGEKLYMMVGEFVDDPENTAEADHHLNKAGYISIVAHNIDTTDYDETRNLLDSGFEVNF
ncbi:stationary phase survival protein SurE [gut metagenome]|uniref:Stationary phase survival protein SurE n=1 Tax=gut metagenome TaxID=749906 RepID=J9FY96_9ZZZZ